MRANEFISETPEEDNQLVEFSLEVAKKLYARSKSYKSYIGDWQLVLGGVTAKDIALKVPNDTLLGKVVNLLKYLIYTDDDAIGGRFCPEDFDITVNALVFKKLPKAQAIAAIQNTVIHEIRHALDWVKGHESAFRGLLSTNTTHILSTGYDDYLKHQVEANARYSEAVLEIANGIPTDNIKLLITNALNNHQLSPDILGRSRYNHMVTRAYRFFELYSNKPPLVTQSWLKRATKFLMGKV